MTQRISQDARCLRSAACVGADRAGAGGLSRKADPAGAAVRRRRRRRRHRPHLGRKLSEKFGQRVYVDNLPGPGGIAAARAVISAAPDGYTLAYVTNGTAISVGAFNALPFDPVKDFAMVSMVGTFDLVLVVNPDSPYKTLADFVNAAKANPGKLNIGTIAVGGTQNLGGELFKSVANLNVQIVPYKTSPDIVVALLRNDVQMMVDFPPAVQGQVNDGKLKILATSSPTKSPLMPSIADRERGRREGLRGGVVERRRRAEGYAEGRYRYPEQGDHRSDGDAGDQGQLRQGRRDRAGQYAGRTDETAGRRHQEVERRHREGRHSEEVIFH